MIGLTNLPETDRLLVQKELRPGEQVRWAAKPDPFRAHLSSYFVWLFAIPWLAISSVFFFASLHGIIAILFGDASPITASMDFFGQKMTMEGSNAPMSLGMATAFFIFSWPFMAIGLGMIAAPFFTWDTAKHTVYVITTERAFSIKKVWRLKVESIRARNVGKIIKITDRFGNGSLTIETGSHRDSDGDKVIDKFEIQAIANVSEAERAINELISSISRVT